MKDIKLITLIILTGCLFSSCESASTENSQTQADTELKTESEETIPKREGAVESDFALQSVDDELADKIKYYLNTDFLTEGDLRAISEDQRKFQLYKVDLNGDGNDEVFVNFMTTYFCGTGGCTVLLLNSDLGLITRFSPVRTLYVEDAFKNGWKVLMTESEQKWRKLIYENSTYPSNPSVVEATNDTPGQQAEKLFDSDYQKSKTYDF